MYARLNDFLMYARSYKDKILTPAVCKLPHWLTPNTLTSVRLFIALLLITLCICQNRDYIYTTPDTSLCLSLIMIGFITDLWDGTTARIKNKVSVTGSLYDAAADKLLILPSAILAVYFFPFLLISMVFLYFHKVFMLMLILVKVSVFNRTKVYLNMQMVYTGCNIAGYSIFLFLFIFDLIS